jgi:hypothetical protein
MKLDCLLDPEPLPLEMGYERLPDGTLHVAARTDMPGCTGEMFQWWFRWFNTTQHYIWWHPGDHVYASWDDRWKAGVSYIGSTCTVDEKLAGDEVHRLLIHFVDPDELFGEGSYGSSDVSAAVTALVGIGADAPVVDGRPKGGRLAHVARDTPTGCTLRSHFFLGTDLAGQLPPAEITAMIPDDLGRGLLKHAYSEFTFLSRILPALYVAENRDHKAVPLPW